MFAATIESDKYQLRWQIFTKHTENDGNDTRYIYTYIINKKWRLIGIACWTRTRDTHNIYSIELDFFFAFFWFVSSFGTNTYRTNAWDTSWSSEMWLRDGALIKFEQLISMNVEYLQLDYEPFALLTFVYRQMLQSLKILTTIENRNWSFWSLIFFFLLTSYEPKYIINQLWDMYVCL